jgi:DNA gyrase/topoisomerase IV subunit A
MSEVTREEFEELKKEVAELKQAQTEIHIDEGQADARKVAEEVSEMIKKKAEEAKKAFN